MNMKGLIYPILFHSNGMWVQNGSSLQNEAKIGRIHKKKNTIGDGLTTKG
ncbi:hypothetical protein GW17_00050303 [Ensete ventricosum]|nr:hypothetical protein GW17_00050303 [Ensete ventricosum]